MKKAEENIIAMKSRNFALRSIAIYKLLLYERHETIMSRQFCRAATSIGANVREGIRAQTKRDFYTKMSIALKEASETEYWLDLLSHSGYLTSAETDEMNQGIVELLKLLMAITKTVRANLSEN